MEGKEVRFGPDRLGHVGRRDDRFVERLGELRSTTASPRSAGSCRSRTSCSARSRRAASGVGLTGMLVLAILTVFIAGLMVGRTPEFLGKKIQGAEMKMVVLHILFAPLVILGFAAASVVLKTATTCDLQLRARTGCRRSCTRSRRRPATTARRSPASATNTNWYNTTMGITMLVGRFFLIIPMLAIAGSLVRKQATPAERRHVPDRHAAVRRAAHRDRRDRRRLDVLPGTGARPHRRAPRRPLLRSR